jgi:hypothetical protein
MAVGIGLSAFTLVVALALLGRALDWPASFPQFLAYAGAALMALVALAFAFWTYACATLGYVLGGEELVVRWGPLSHRIPLSAITSVTPGRGEQRPRIAGIGWMGYHAGRGEVDGIGRVLFFSTHRVPEEIVYVQTADVAYGLSPQDPARFVAGLEKARKAGDGAGTPLVEREIIAAHPIWSDRVAQWLTLAAVLMNAALWGYLLASYPDLSNEIAIEFPPIGDITTLQPKDEILKIPATASAVLAVNLLAALLFHPKERAATYLLLSGTVFFQAVFWVAAVVAVLNA